MRLLKKITKKYKWLRFLNKKVTKLSLLGVSLIGLCISSGYSFAKYRDENYGGGNAAAAKFGEWVVTQSIVSVNIPEEREEGFYAFVANFDVHFTAGEVAREYTLKIKGVDFGVTSSKDTFNSSVQPDALYYFLDSSFADATEDIYTVLDGKVISSSKNNVIGTLIGNDKVFFSPDKVYLYSGELQTNIESGKDEYVGNWNDIDKDDIYNSESQSITIASNHKINATETDHHLYKIIFFIDTKGIGETSNFKFIYNLEVGQVM